MFAKTITKHLKMTKIWTMNIFVYILEGQVYKKVSNCFIFIKQIYCTTSNVFTKTKM